jgi:hypothetical protein
MAYYDSAAFGGLFNKAPDVMKVNKGTDGYEKMLGDLCSLNCVKGKKPEKSKIPFETIQYFLNSDNTRYLYTLYFTTAAFGDDFAFSNDETKDSWSKPYMQFFRSIKKNGLTKNFVFSYLNQGQEECKTIKCPGGFDGSKLFTQGGKTLQDFFKDKTIYKIAYINPTRFTWYAPVDKSSGKSSFGRRKQGVLSEIKYLQGL